MAPNQHVQETIDRLSYTQDDQIQPAHKVGEEALDSHIYDDHGDPHSAALNDPGEAGHVKATTWIAVCFLSLTFVPSLSLALNTFAPVATTVAMEVQGNLDNLNWITGGFSLGGSVSFAIAGQLSDYFGRKGVILTGQVLLLIGFLLGASAQTFNQILAAMAIIGAGAGVTFVIYSSISEILPNKWRAFGIAITEIMLLILGAFGPVYGRAITLHSTWRWIFILGDITSLIALCGTVFFYRPPTRIFQDRSRTQVLRELDYLGIGLYASGVTLVLLALGWGGTQYSWTSAAVIAPITIGGILFLGAFIWDFSSRPLRPLFPLRLLKRFREYNSLLIISFATGLAHITLSTFIPQQISYVFTSDPITAGWYNLPNSIGACLGGVLMGGLIPIIKHIPLQLLVANVLQTLGCGLLALATPNRIAAGLALQLIANIPFTWILILCYTTAGLHIPQRDLGLSYGLLGGFRYLGGAVGSTVFNTILQSKVAHTVPSRVVQAVLPLHWPADKVGMLIEAISSRSPSALKGIPPNVLAAATEAIRWGYSDAFRYVWYASIPFFVIACAVSPFVLDAAPYMTHHTAVKMTNDTDSAEGKLRESKEIVT